MSALDDARSLIDDAASVVVFSGAGMSADSGIPTFRDALTGLWSRFDPEQLATPRAWHSDRALVWAWYAARAAGVRRAQPNAGHRAVAELGRVKNVTVVTQNVDDLHERAGSEQVIHLHGSLFAPRCEACDAPYASSSAASDTTSAPTDVEPDVRVEPPRCALCDAAVRPGVVWFGENLPADAWRAAEAAIAAADVMIVVGTSGLVYPAAALPERARETGSRVIIVNPDCGAGQGADVIVEMTAAAALPTFV